MRGIEWTGRGSVSDGPVARSRYARGQASLIAIRSGAGGVIDATSNAPSGLPSFMGSPSVRTGLSVAVE